MKKIIPTLLLLALVAVVPAYAATAGFWSPSVRVIHASPNAPNVDVWANGNPLFTDVTFGDAQTATGVPQGRYTVQVVPAGLTEPVVIDAKLRFKNNRDYTVIAVDRVENIAPIVLTDRLTPQRHRAQVRFVHASPDAPNVDIAVKNGPVLFQDVAFKDARNHIRVPGGTYDLEVRVAGTDIVALSLDGITFENGKAYTAIAIGELGEGTLGAALFQDRTRPFTN